MCGVRNIGLSVSDLTVLSEKSCLLFTVARKRFFVFLRSFQFHGNKRNVDFFIYLIIKSSLINLFILSGLKIQMMRPSLLISIFPDFSK